MAGEDLEHEKQESEKSMEPGNEEEERFGTKQQGEGSGGVSGLSNPTGIAR
jgi:hypothetical protein